MLQRDILRGRQQILLPDGTQQASQSPPASEVRPHLTEALLNAADDESRVLTASEETDYQELDRLL